MSMTNFKSHSIAIVTSLILIGASISAGSSASAFDVKRQGQDLSGKNCERVDSKESSTFGKCESVCKDKEIVKKDVENNRYICNAAAITRPPKTHGSIGGTVLENASGAKPSKGAKTEKIEKTEKVKKTKSQ
jgi:hypothetical protein